MQPSEARKAEERAEFARLLMSGETKAKLMRASLGESKRFKEQREFAQVRENREAWARNIDKWNERQAAVPKEMTEVEERAELETKSHDLAAKARAYAEKHNVSYAFALKSITPRDEKPQPNAPGLTKPEREQLYLRAAELVEKKGISMMQAVLQLWPRDKSMKDKDQPDVEILCRAQRMAEEGIAVGQALDEAEKQVTEERKAQLQREREKKLR